MKAGLSIILSSLFLCCIPLQVFAAEKLTISELLDRYAGNQNKLKSFIAKTEFTWMPSADNTVDKAPQQRRYIAVFRYEDIGKGFKAYYCRTPYRLDNSGVWVEEDLSKSTMYLWRDRLYYQYYKGPRLEVSSLDVTSDPEYAGKGQFEIPYDGVGPFLGFLCQDREPVESILRNSDSLSVRSELERVGSVDCYVIDAKSKHGTYTVWFDPEHGYGITKAVVRKGPEDLRWGRPRSFYINPVDNSTGVIQNVRFECVDGIWFPVEFERLLQEESEDRNLSGCSRYKVISLDVNPDHEEIGSFKLDGLGIQNGTRIDIVEEPEKEYTWQDSMKFVLDQWDSRIKYVPKDWSILVGINKTMPKFEGIELDLTAEKTKDEAILLCFFDMQQRPSRHCLQQLAEKSAALKEKDVVVVAIQASEIEQTKLDEWIEENDISFPVGRITADIENIRFSWGVRSLPWLILTDKEHTVTAEGFALTELDKKLLAK